MGVEQLEYGNGKLLDKFQPVADVWDLYAIGEGEILSKKDVQLRSAFEAETFGKVFLFIKHRCRFLTH